MNWSLVLSILAGIILVQTLLKNVFGVDMIGKKIYKGAPWVWRWLMRAQIDRKSIHVKLDKIWSECSYNSGTSLKDVVRRIENASIIQTEMLKDLKHSNDVLSLRADINDITNDRMIFRLDDKAGCIFINEAFLKSFGYNERDILGHNWESIIHDEDLEETLNRWARAIKTKSRFYNEQRIWHCNGELQDVRIVGYPIVNDNKLEGFYGTIDIVIKN